METFIGRKNELQSLKETFESDRSEFRIVRGRRRVGKTRLLKEAIGGMKNVIFISGLEDVNSDRKVRDRFIEKLAEFSNSALLNSAQDVSWPHIFQITAELAETRKSLVLVLDEIQWLARHGSGFLSDLKEAWTTKFQPAGNIKIIICGSSNKFFELKTGSAETVLYKLRTMSDIWVMPMTLGEVGMFCRGWNRHELVLTQMMFGGIPYYLDLISGPERGFMQCVNDIAFTAKTIFFDEVKETLKLDLSSIERAVEILSVIGQDGKIMERIAKDSLVPTSTLDELLEKLVSYQILFKSYPVGETPKAKNFGVRYYIKDEFLNFYFNVLDKNKGRIKNNVRNKMILGAVIEGGYFIKNFTGKAFELVVRKIIERNISARINNILSIDDLSNYETGSYWKTEDMPGNQIDLMIDSDEDRCVRLIEVKWLNDPVGVEKGNAIEQALGRNFPNRKGHLIRRFVMASSGFTSKARAFAKENNVFLIEFGDLFDPL